MTANPSQWYSRICVMGVGFVGRSLLRQFGSTFDCIGFDISIKSIREASVALEGQSKVSLTSRVQDISQATHYLIAVPTPSRKDGSVNLEYVIAALRLVLEVAKPGSCIVIESSVPVGATRELLGPIQHEYHCGMSPERIDPGRSNPIPRKIPKLVSGLTRRAQKQMVAVYSRVYDTVIPVSSPEVAEMTKLYENCFRMVNIAYVNEVSDACLSYSIDPNEVIQAAATKPFGFIPFYPGLGVGGHCIQSNSSYLLSGHARFPVLEKATALMMERPRRLATLFYRDCVDNLALGSQNSGKKPKILILGAAFKVGQADTSSSPSLEFARTLSDQGCQRLTFHDPLVPEESFDFMDKLHPSQWSASYVDLEFDAVALCLRQPGIDLSVLDKLQNCIVRSYV